MRRGVLVHPIRKHVERGRKKERDKEQTLVVVLVTPAIIFSRAEFSESDGSLSANSRASRSHQIRNDNTVIKKAYMSDWKSK